MVFARNFDFWLVYTLPSARDTFEPGINILIERSIDLPYGVVGLDWMVHGSQLHFLYIERVADQRSCGFDKGRFLVVKQMFTCWASSRV